MRTRGPAAWLLLVLLVAACGSGGPEEGTGAVLRYAYEPGDSLAYDLEASMDMDMTASGNAAAAAGMDASLVMSVTGRLDLRFAVGPSPDTVEITVAQELLEGGARMTTLGGETLIPLSDLADQMEQEVVVVVDPQGRPVSMSVNGTALSAQMLGVLSGFGGGETLTPQQFGPEFPITGLYVGAEWETDNSGEVLGLAFRQHGRHKVVAEEQVLGRTAYRIDSRLTTAELRTDLTALMAALRATPELLGGADPAEFDAAIAQFESMGVAVDVLMEEYTVTMTTWFDPAQGIVLRSVTETPMAMTMVMRGFPGGEVEVLMETTTEQRLTLAA
ncbi:MAG: hypothetical protein JW785_01855 [Acidimicrobiia bacterium]|nr:hypothetical protein [Acidimicrobiia bacterium]